nr:MAG: hypothetical protein [uncultured archaeon]
MEIEINNYVKIKIMPPLMAFKNTLESVGTGLKRDIQVVSAQGETMTNTIKVEMENIKNGLVGFGSSIKNEAINLSNAAKKVGEELIEVIYEMSPALNASIAQAKAAASDAKNLRALKAVVHAWKAIAHLVFKGKDGQGAVLPEMIEGFGEIKNAFINLKNNFSSFGNTIQNQSTGVSNQISTSSTNIKNSTDAFLISFKGIFDNMSERIRGGTGEVIKEIEWIKIEVPTETRPVQAPYVPSPEKLATLMLMEERQTAERLGEPTTEPTPTPTHTTEESKRGIQI